MKGKRPVIRLREVIVLCSLTLLLTLPAVAATRTLLDSTGRRLQVDINERFPAERHPQLMAWIDHIASTLAQVYGHWPEKNWRITVEPASGASTDVIPWAQVHRGDVDSIEFFVLTNATTDALNREWTGYHELAHLLIPYRGWGDAWFSEGLASYYQNLLQGRAGLLDEQQMWQKLYNGFMRGRNDMRFDGQPLSTVSDELRSKGGFMRVYWSGAWYFLAADVALRRNSGSGLTLDLALGRLNQCCSGGSLSVPEMVSRLDELNRVDVFSSLYQQALTSTAVPNFESLFSDLGIAVRNGEVKLAPNGDGAKLRREMLKFQTL